MEAMASANVELIEMTHEIMHTFSTHMVETGIYAAVNWAITQSPVRRPAIIWSISGL